MALDLPVVINIEEKTRDNEAFRVVFDTTDQMQLVFMSLLPGEDIGFEVHPNVTQFIRIEEGTGIAVLNNREYRLDNRSAVFIPAGTWHNIINTGKIPLKLYTIYSPPNHPYDRLELDKPID